MAGVENFKNFKEGYRYASFPKENQNPSVPRRQIIVASVHVVTIEALKKRREVEVLRCAEVLLNWWKEWPTLEGADDLWRLEMMFYDRTLNKFTRNFFSRLAFMMGYMVGCFKPRIDSFTLEIPLPPPFETDSEDDMLPSLD